MARVPNIGAATGETKAACVAGMADGWTVSGKVRARETADGAVEVMIDGLTTQARYYKPLVYEFFRKEWRGARPAWGDFSVEIRMEYQGDAPWMDLDNLAKALLDALKGWVFHDDAQVARLLVERFQGERERITVKVNPIPGPGSQTA
jgi:crossover junction endodeoxyribonuclease RusA